MDRKIDKYIGKQIEIWIFVHHRSIDQSLNPSDDH